VLEALADMREDRWSVEVLLETDAGEARAQLPKMGVTLQETPEGVVMRSSTSDLAWMARVLAGLSFPFVVRTPPELRESLRSLAAEIAALAERT
jgi:predicted DNA-binding transcriptional regulator YafY